MEDKNEMSSDTGIFKKEAPGQQEPPEGRLRRARRAVTKRKGLVALMVILVVASLAAGAILDPFGLDDVVGGSEDSSAASSDTPNIPGGGHFGGMECSHCHSDSWPEECKGLPCDSRFPQSVGGFWQALWQDSLPRV